MAPIFITGIGTDVGKTLIASIVTEALEANYWKPVQAGYADGTDAELVASLIGNQRTIIYPEVYKLSMPASPHIAARNENITIDIDHIVDEANKLRKENTNTLVIEGAGGLLVPLSDENMVADLAAALGAKVILVSRNYLGSINHSLLTAQYCRSRGLDVGGWIFSDDYLQYESEIVRWSGYPSIGSVPKLENITRESVQEQAAKLRPALRKQLNLPR